MPGLLPLNLLLAAALSVPAAPPDDHVIVLDTWGFTTLDEVLYAGHYDIVVATILAVKDSGATQANPPRVTIDVHQVLRGHRRRGPQGVRWMPAPLFMPCDVGEEGNIARWNATPLKGPAAGARMILGGERDERSGEWGCSVFCRWEDSDSLRADVRRRVRLWAPEVARRRRESAERQRAEREQAREREARAEAARRDRERGWIARERAIARAADIERLARSSGDIVLAVPVGPLTWSHHERLLKLQVIEWLRTSSRAEAASGSLQVLLGSREDSLAGRWAGGPPDLVPGSLAGEPVTCIAFLRFAHDSVAYSAPATCYRAVDASSGLILSDARAIRRVRAAISDRPGEPEPRAGCGASFSEFAGLTPDEAAEVGVKLTVTGPVRTPDARFSLVLGCPPSRERVLTSITTSWFAPCLLPDDRYAQDFMGNGWDVRSEPAEMKALLDSLGSLPALRQGMSNPGDSLTLTLRRVKDGSERIYESTMDGATFLAVARILSSIFVGAGYPPNASTPSETLVRINLLSWTSQVDRRCAPLWPMPRPTGTTPRK